MTKIRNIQMVDLKGQYQSLQSEIDTAVLEVIRSAYFIGGPKVASFKKNLADYLGVKHVISCANGTDALQIALMSLNLEPGDEVIVPAFTYAATAEVIGLLGLSPVMVDVKDDTFNTTAELIKAAITPKTKAIIPVHLFGQSTDMQPIMELAKAHNLYVIEDNAQAIGADYSFADGTKKKTGGIGHIGCTSFYPSKNLGAYGDGGAIFTNDDNLAFKLQKIANHGQSERYFHDVLGVNSRLDAMQAVVLDIKLKHLDSYHHARQEAASFYDEALKSVPALQIPAREANSSHVFHQYTLRVKNGKRNELKAFLQENGIPSMIYYPVPLYKQKAYVKYWNGKELPATEILSEQVISLPMHTELDEDTLKFICEKVKEFFRK